MTDESERREEESEKKFKIVDRRRINPDEIEAAEPELQPEPPEESEQPDKVPEEEIPDEIKEPPEYEEADKEEFKPDEDPLAFLNIILSFLQTLMTVAWVRLGLVPHPQTKLIAKNLEEAKKAIDLFETLMNMTSTDLPPQIEAELHRALQEMKANYINQL